jgi:hypothetical protein
MRKPTLNKLSTDSHLYTLVFPCFNPLAEKEIKRGRHGHFQIDFRLPMEQSPRIPDTGTAVLKILIARAIVNTAFGFPEPGKGRESVAQRVVVKHFHQHLRKPADTRLIVGISKIDNLTVAFASFIFNDAKETFDPVANIRKAAFLLSTVNQEDGATFNEI